MYIVTVEIVIVPEHRVEFLAAMQRNARDSVADEPGCRQFDVCVLRDDESRIFLYEVYDDEAAFSAHRATAHFREFMTVTEPWISSKSARFFRRLK